MELQVISAVIEAVEDGPKSIQQITIVLEEKGILSEQIKNILIGNWVIGIMKSMKMEKHVTVDEQGNICSGNLSVSQ